MRITYDKVSPEYLYPLNSKSDFDFFRNEIQKHILDRIRLVRFGCNWKTTQEARLVQRGECFDIRINFCLKNYRSPILSDKKDWSNTIEKFGGVLDLSSNTVEWSLANSKRYSMFLLFHEVGHIAYCIKHFGGKITNKKGSSSEERWCESYALDAINKI
jgi:hypothetical protein